MILSPYIGNGSAIQKIDSLAVDGLLGVNNSLSYKVHEIERHFHGTDKFFGLAAVASGETHVADRVGGSILPFPLTAGNDDFGSWVQILGSSDTPFTPGAVKFDMSKMLTTTTNSTNAFILQFASGESAGLAAKIAAEDFTETMHVAATNNADSGIEGVKSPRIVVGEKLWARTCCIDASGSTIAAYFALHEYEG